MHRYKHGNAIAQAISFAYPEHPWDVTKFTSAQRGFYTFPNNNQGKNWTVKEQRVFLDKLMKKMDFRSLDDWYTVNFRELADDNFPIRMFV